MLNLIKPYDLFKSRNINSTLKVVNLDKYSDE